MHKLLQKLWIRIIFGCECRRWGYRSCGECSKNWLEMKHKLWLKK